MPITLAQDSESGSVTAELVDIGPGTAESDYAGKDIAGKLVLTSSQPEDVTPQSRSPLVYFRESPVGAC